MGDHAAFIIATYAVTAIVLLAVIGWTLVDHMRLKRALQRFPARGDNLDGGR